MRNCIPLLKTAHCEISFAFLKIVVRFPTKTTLWFYSGTLINNSISSQTHFVLGCPPPHYQILCWINIPPVTRWPSVVPAHAAFPDEPEEVGLSRSLISFVVYLSRIPMKILLQVEPITCHTAFNTRLVFFQFTQSLLCFNFHIWSPMIRSY